MSATRSLRCVFHAARAAQPVCNHFRALSTSTSRANKARSSRSKISTPASSKATQTSATIPESIRPLNDEEWKELEKKYTVEQLAAIKASEEAIDPADMLEQGALRNDSMSITYLDDFSTIRRYIDHKPTKFDKQVDPYSPYFSDDGVSADPTGDELLGAALQRDELIAHPAGGLRRKLSVDDSYVEDALPRIPDPLMRRAARATQVEQGSEQTQFFADVSKQTGIPVANLKQLRMKKLVQHRVVNQTHMGKIQSMYVLVVVGNGDGMLGIGESSSAEVEVALTKARRNAIRSMMPIHRYENRTIFGDVKGKVGATELELFTRPPGFGVRCQERILEMCKCAGITDLAARVTRARNPMNTVKAAYQALLSQRHPEQVARARGRKMVDVRKVYYAGMT